MAYVEHIRCKQHICKNTKNMTHIVIHDVLHNNLTQKIMTKYDIDKPSAKFISQCIINYPNNQGIIDWVHKYNIPIQALNNNIVKILKNPLCINFHTITCKTCIDHKDNCKNNNTVTQFPVNKVDTNHISNDYDNLLNKHINYEVMCENDYDSNTINDIILVNKSLNKKINQTKSSLKRVKCNMCLVKLDST